jgi:hypothetical protein
MTYLTHLTLLCPEGAAAQSPGLPLRLPWELKQESFSTARRLRQYSKPSCGRNRDAVVRLRIAFSPRVAEAATLGFEA